MESLSSSYKSLHTEDVVTPVSCIVCFQSLVVASYVSRHRRVWDPESVPNGSAKVIPCALT